MTFDWIAWDDEGDDPNNVRHIAEHGVTPEEVEEVLVSVADSAIRRSRSTGRPIVRGDTAAGRTLFVVFDLLDIPDLVVIYPITAYDAQE